MTDLWFEKYRPTTLTDIVIGEHKLREIRDWFVSFSDKTAEKKALLFTGPPGIGKTSLAHIILKQFGYKIKEFNASDIRSQSLVREAMSNLICISDITNDELPVGIIMDEVDGMSTGDKGGLDEFLNFIQPNKARKTKKKKDALGKEWGPPIICICNTGNIKKAVMMQLRAHCFEISFTKPTTEDLMKTVNHIENAENMQITAPAKAEIIKYAQGDFRRLVSLMQYLRLNGTQIDIAQINESYQIFCKKEQDLHVEEDVTRVINQSLDYNSVMNVYFRHKTQVPMVMHKNYIKAIDAQKANPFDKINNAIATINSLVDSDIIEKTMYNTQGWGMQTIQGISCSFIPSYYINRFKKIRVIDAGWTDVLGTNGQAQATKNKIQEILYAKPNRYSNNTDDIQVLAELVLYLFLNKQSENAVKLLKHYGLVQSKILDKLMSIIKLNPCYDQWKGLTSSEKNKFDALIVSNISNNVKEQKITKSAFKPNASTSTSTKAQAQTQTQTQPLPRKINITAKEKTRDQPQPQPKIKISVTEKKTPVIISKKNPKRKLVLAPR